MPKSKMQPEKRQRASRPSRSLVEVGELAGASILSVADVTRLLNIDRTTLWRWCRQQRFPQRRQLGPNRVGFVAAEVKAWLASRPAVAGAKSQSASGGTAADSPTITVLLPTLDVTVINRGDDEEAGAKP